MGVFMDEEWWGRVGSVCEGSRSMTPNKKRKAAVATVATRFQNGAREREIYGETERRRDGETERRGRRIKAKAESGIKKEAFLFFQKSL